MYVDNRPTRPVPVVHINGHTLTTRPFDDLLNGPAYKRRPPVWTIRRIARAATRHPGTRITRKVCGAIFLGVMWWLGLAACMLVAAGITVLLIAAVLVGMQ